MQIVIFTASNTQPREHPLLRFKEDGMGQELTPNRA